MVPPTQVGGYRLWLLSYRPWLLALFLSRETDTRREGADGFVGVHLVRRLMAVATCRCDSMEGKK
jgi:hypothetical protein